MLEVIVWGSRGSTPVSGARFQRHGGATTCIEIIPKGAEDEATPSRLIIDSGTGLTELGKSWGERRADALLLQSHMHWDHIQGFPFFAPLFNPMGHFELWGVPRDGMNLREVLSKQMTPPTFPVGLDIIPASLNFRDLPKEGESRLGELSIEWIEVEHPSGATAYRINYKGVSVVFSGDLEIQLGHRKKFIEFVEQSDLLIMDAQYLPEEYVSRKGFGHSTFVDAVDVASQARVKRLLMTHHDPTHDDNVLDKKRDLARNIAPNYIQIDNAYDKLDLLLGSPSTKKMQSFDSVNAHLLS